MWNISLSFYIFVHSLSFLRYLQTAATRPSTVFKETTAACLTNRPNIFVCKSVYALLLFNLFSRPFRHIIIHSCENMKPFQIQPGKKTWPEKIQIQINTTIVFLGRHNIYTVTRDAEHREVEFQCFIDPTPCYLCMGTNYIQPLSGMRK